MSVLPKVSSIRPPETTLIRTPEQDSKYTPNRSVCPKSYVVYPFDSVPGDSVWCNQHRFADFPLNGSI